MSLLPLSTRLRATVVVAVAATVAAAGGAAVAAPRAAQPAPRPIVSSTPAIAWGTCEQRPQQRLGLQCALVDVPLDHAHPEGGTISVEVARKPASGTRKGSVVINPGGPGLQATTMMGPLISTLGPKVTGSYDVVAVDPRGVGNASSARCWTQAGEPDSGPAFPTSEAEVKARVGHDDYVRRACADTSRPIIDHMTTADAARDLDLVREALGDRDIAYYGTSYGTMLGQTYAALFPDRVRAMVLDGVVDPVAWTTGRADEATTTPVSARNGAAAGAQETLEAAFAACAAAGEKRCPGGSRVASEWKELMAALRTGPVSTGEGQLSLAGVTGNALHAMYSPEGYGPLMAQIHADHQRLPGPSRTQHSRDSRIAVEPTTPMPDDVAWWDTPRQAAVMCADSLNPSDPAAWKRAADAGLAAGSDFAPIWTWMSSLCASWPGASKGAYRGPFDVAPAHPIVFVGNTHDPSTPLTSARSAAALSPGARLVTVDAFGHTAGTQSTCALDAMRAYLADGTLPAKDLHCSADQPLF